MNLRINGSLAPQSQAPEIVYDPNRGQIITQRWESGDDPHPPPSVNITSGPLANITITGQSVAVQDLGERHHQAVG